MSESQTDTTDDIHDAPAFIRELISFGQGKYIGQSDDGSRIGIYTNRISSLDTDMALKNGYVVDEVHHDRKKSDYKLQVQFKSLA